MIHPGVSVFVDTGVWIALALTRDPYHERAKEAWDSVYEAGAVLFTSVPIVLETFTFLERNARRDVALSWKDSLADLRRFKILTCTPRDLEEAWPYFHRQDLHKLSAVDATSFAVMSRKRIPVALSFDHHFAMVGFQMVG